MLLTITVFNLFMITLLFYVFLSSNLNLDIRIFFSLFLAILFFFGFIFSFNYLLNLKEPLYRDQIAISTLIRYVIFIIVICASFLYYLLKRYKSFYSTTVEFFSSPFIFENLRLFINNLVKLDILIIISNNLINDLRYTKLRKSLYISSYIMLKFIIPFLSTCIFINFAFFYGDLRYMVYILPFSLFAYLFSFYVYWLDLYSKKNLEYGNKILNVRLKSNINPDIATIAVTSNSFDISLTPFGISKGYLNTQLPLLSENWITFAHFRHLMRIYTKKTLYISRFFLLANMLSYINILILFSKHV